MSMYKTIFSGRLEFGTQRSYDKVYKMYEHRMESYYRNDILLKEIEELFDGDNFSYEVPRYIVNSTKKSWSNTVNLLEYIAQFAVAGTFRAWMTEDGKKLAERIIEPKSDKIAVQHFLKGRELVDKKGQEVEAISSLNRAIEKFDRHANAYERRGHVNFMLRNFDDAMYDFTKSIDLGPNNPEPYFGRANVKLRQKDIANAIPDLEMACKKSIPHMTIYWQARRLKGETHMALKEYAKAAFELKLFTRRKFAPDDINYKYRKKSLNSYGKALTEIGEYPEAIEAFSKAVEIDNNTEVKPADPFLFRGIARKKAGKNGFKKDWKEAATLGSKEAEALLSTKKKK